MRELVIHRLFFTESDCYKKGAYQTQRGVQVHSTGANNPNLRRYVQPNDGLLGNNPNNNSHNRPGGDVCANAYIGKLQDGTVAVYQTLPWEYRCWLSGSGKNGNANKLGYIGFEICEDSTENEEYFNQAVRGAAVLLTAYLCKRMNVTPWTVIQEKTSRPAYAVMDHAELHAVGLASNHGDIGLWLKKFGYTFSDFRYWVQEALEEGVQVTYAKGEEQDMIEHPILRQGNSGNAVMYLQTLLCDVGEPLTVDGKFGGITESAVKDFQRIYGLDVDGIVGPKTWEALEKATGDSESPPDGPPEENEPNETVTISRDDWETIRQIVRKYETVG